MAIFRTERVVVRVMCSVKLVDKQNMEILMNMLGLKKTDNRLVKKMKCDSVGTFSGGMVILCSKGH